MAHFGDAIGPEKVLTVYNPAKKWRAFLVIDNTVRGPGKGGIRMTGTVTEKEVFRLARAMTLKTALADLPFGGAKSGIALDPKRESAQTKKEAVQWFARAIQPLLPKYYIAAPDINMAEKEMQWFVEAHGSRRAATGKPKKLGGLPHELGSTGYGVAYATEEALAFLGKKVQGATVAIEGFGNVGSFTCKFLEGRGARIVAVSDSRGVAYDLSGLSYKTLSRVKRAKGSVAYAVQRPQQHADIFALPVDVLIPAALPDAINEKNADAIQAKVIVEGANIAIQKGVEKKLHARGVLIVPDIAANAGGVIASYAEDRGWGEKTMWRLIKKKITASVRAVLRESAKKGIDPKKAAEMIAVARINPHTSRAHSMK